VTLVEAGVHTPAASFSFDAFADKISASGKLSPQYVQAALNLWEEVLDVLEQYDWVNSKKAVLHVKSVMDAALAIDPDDPLRQEADRQATALLGVWAYLAERGAGEVVRSPVSELLAARLRALDADEPASST